MKGLVIRNTGYSYTVLADGTEEIFDCKFKGKFRIKGIRNTNPVAIGDRVEFVPEAVETDTEQAHQGLITSVSDRRNYIIRKSTNLSKESHIIAANVDACFLVVTIVQPETSLTFIDRFLASAEAYSVPVTLVFNKVDLLEGSEELLDETIAMYESIGYECLRVSASSGYGMEALRDAMKGKVVCLSGNSGVGKSTIINYICPHLNLRTGEISDAYNTGKHTTTFSEMYPLFLTPDGESDWHGGVLIDTPGIKGFGTFNMKKEEVSHYFRDIFDVASECRFNNCIHTHEPHCAVMAAVEEGTIPFSRYSSYLSMLDDEDEEKYR